MCSRARSKRDDENSKWLLNSNRTMPTRAGPCNPYPKRIARQTKLRSNRSLGGRRCWLRRFRAARLRSFAYHVQGVLGEQSFPFRIALAPHTAISDRQVEVARGIRRPELLNCLERRYRFGVLLIEGQRHPQPEKRVYKTGIELRSPGKMFDGLRNLLRLACKLSQDVFRASVCGVNFQLALELLLGLFRQCGIRIRLREQN